MTDDPHAQANAEQVRVLREALAGQVPRERPRESPGLDSNRARTRESQPPVRACPPEEKTL